MNLFRTNPRGKSSLTVVLFVVVAVVVAVFAPVAITTFFGGTLIASTIFTAGAVGVACVTNVINCGGGGSTASSGGGGGTQASALCSSNANACGQTNTGTVSTNGTCSATTPPNSQCPQPMITQGSGFYATPSTIGPGGSSNLTWNAANATACTLSGDNGFSQSGASSGSISTGALSATTLFTLTCTNGPSGPTASKSVKVIIDPHYQEI